MPKDDPAGLSEIPKKAIARSAKLAGLPLSYAGRTALGLGKRLGGAPAEQVLAEIQQKTAAQIFRTLGELKGGAMKVGQAMSILESALPEDLVAPYREQLTQLQDAAPPMPTQTVREILTTELGENWKQQIIEFDPLPAAAASIGQVHRGRWVDGREVAIKVQYPGAEAALMADFKQLARVARSVGAMLPGIDVKPLIQELKDRTREEVDYQLEAEAQAAFAAAFHDHPEIDIPNVVSVGPRVLVTEWLESESSLAAVIKAGSQKQRDHFGNLFTNFMFEGVARTGMLHADPHPGNFRIIPAGRGKPKRLGVLDFGAVARLPNREFPSVLGQMIRAASDNDPELLVAICQRAGFIRPGAKIDPQILLDYLGPFVEPASVPKFRFSREWMRTQFERINNPQNPGFTTILKLNLPPEYMLIHRTWVGGIGVMSQLEAEAGFRQILLDYMPGFND